MKHNRIPVPAKVMEGLEAVRLSGKTNMFDARMVVFLALDMGYLETATWVHENTNFYAQGILTGFASEEEASGPESKIAGRITGCEGGDQECAD